MRISERLTMSFFTKITLTPKPGKFIQQSFLDTDCRNRRLHSSSRAMSRALQEQRALLAFSCAGGRGWAKTSPRRGLWRGDATLRAPVQELNGLATREVGGKKVILPIWHKVNFEEVREFSPTLADKLASKSDVGVDKLVEGILQVLE
jgi:hypothetical protein